MQFELCILGLALFNVALKFPNSRTRSLSPQRQVMSDKLQFVDRERQAKACLTFWGWWLPPTVLSLILGLIFVDPFIGDWDAFEYTLSALRGAPSSMALGRSLFIFYNHALYLIAHTLFGLPPHRAYLLFKYVVLAQGALAIIACWVLTHDLTRSRHAATIAALLVAFSPVFILYSGQVMTDVPALLITTTALIIHLRGLCRRNILLMMIGAALLGAGVNLRETVSFYAPWLILAPFVCGWPVSRKTLVLVAASSLIFLVCAGSAFGFWFLADPNYRAAWYGWRESMRVESARHPVSFRIVWPWLAFFLATAPLVPIYLPFGMASEWRKHRLSPILLIAAIGLFANLLLLANYSTAVIWRYFLTGLPALVPLSANYFIEWFTSRLGTTRRAFMVCATVIGLIAIAFGIYSWPLRNEIVSVRAASKEYDKDLKQLPRDAVMISGAQSVAVKYWRGVGEGDWDVIAPGAGWPGPQLPAMIADYLKQGRRVFIDADPHWWQPCGWHVPEIEELTKLQSRFHFRRAARTIYEIRPSEDLSATDQPHLEDLLPENRPEEVKSCFNPG